MPAVCGKKLTKKVLDKHPTIQSNSCPVSGKLHACDNHPKHAGNHHCECGLEWSQETTR